ncbi:hypothetical protein PFISCL1PPCAC_10128, partial [Pristionchus fissidentatus]
MILRLFPSPSSSLLLLLIFSSLLPPVIPRRGGTGGMSSGRGSSGVRSGGGLFGRGSGGSAPRSGGGGGGGGGLFGGRSQPAVPGHGSSGGWMGGAAAGGAMGHGMRQHGQGGMGGMGGHSGMGGGGGLFGGGMRNNQPRYSKSGVGSFVRSNSFKNAIVGAAAGYLTYQAGKAIIRAAAGPMYWNNRPYYWGPNHFRPSHGQSNMCRMPIQQDDQQFGNVYFQIDSPGNSPDWMSSHDLSQDVCTKLISLLLLISLPLSIDCRGSGGRGSSRGRAGSGRSRGG